MKEKVIVARCVSYEKSVVKEAINKIFILSDISNNHPDKVLFKPNMLSARPPEDGVTTHPAIVEATVRLLRSSKKIIGDSPANINKTVELYWEKCGYKNASENTGVPLVKFSNSIMIEVEVSNKKEKVPVTEYLKGYTIFNLPKLKTHGLTVMTAALKNLYGLIPGFHKSVLHSRFISPYEFSEFLVSYYQAIKSCIFFNLVDAIISMEGEGPSAGSPIHTGYLIGGSNTVAVDMVCCSLIGLKVEDVPYLKIYKERYGLPEIEIIGDTIITAKKFHIPGRKRNKIFSSRILKPFLHFLAKYFKAIPVIDHAICKKCYACREVCPVKVISENLKFNRKKCINCLCCFEVCPYKAIKIKKSFIAKLFT
ncbi:MAG: DUF362 domain-containing protein [Candidatus Omnitrophica bacterium]|nr:DUF362 domain-containing protein [Candidatus Omnitrophota bacterium]